MISDVQFIAQVLVKTRTGDQVTDAEADRLEDIAKNGRTTGWRAPSRTPQVVEVPSGPAIALPRGGQI